MKIVVCIKQVPASSNVAIDPDTGVLLRDGSACKMNPYDLYALETAFRIKEQNGAQVHAVHDGSPQCSSGAEGSYLNGSGSRLSDFRIGLLLVRMF